MKQNTWLNCHVNMYKYFGGSTIRLVCDNLKTGVISHPKDGEIILNDKYEELGNYYLTAIMPAGVKKPKHKPSVEGTFGKIATAIIARLRNETFHNFAELKAGIITDTRPGVYCVGINITANKSFFQTCRHPQNKGIGGNIAPVICTKVYVRSQLPPPEAVA